MAGMVAIALVAAVAGWLLGRQPWLASSDRPLPIVRTLIELPHGYTLAPMDRSYPLAVSRDGLRLAFVAEFEGRSQLFVRELAESEARPLAGTAGGSQPFFSPDGRWIAYFAGRTLQKVAVAGGAPIRICDITVLSSGGVWTPDDTIVFAAAREGLFKVGASGGTPERIDASGLAAFPDVLGDGRTILYTTGDRFPSTTFATIGLDGTGKRVIARVSDAPGEGPALLGSVEVAQARFATSGHIVYGQSPGSVRVMPFDATAKAVTGPAVSVVDSVERGAGGGAVYFAISQTGTLMYVGSGERHELVWVDRQGLETPITGERAAFRIPRVSPDGRRIAVAINDEARRSDIWIYDADRGTRSRLTTNQHNLNPYWTPDGTHVTFNSDDGIVEVNVDGPPVRTPLNAPRDMGPSGWTPDGHVFLLQTFATESRDIMMMRRGEAPRPLLTRPFNEWWSHVSPDGRWVAYVSDESGRPEIYVERFPQLGNRLAVSFEGGLYPRWSRDGRELFYRQGDSVMAVAVQTQPTLRAERPRRLFAGAYTGTGQDSSFDVSADGKRFVMVKSDEASTRRRVSVVQHWPALIANEPSPKK
jgi:serine/threonine-protein kinase